MENKDSSEIFKHLYEKFGEAEKSKDLNAEEFFKEHLHDDLIFHRATDVVHNKKQFLEELVNPKKIYHEIRTEVKDIFISEQTDLAMVSALVYVKLTNDGKDMEGNFMNVRVFKMEDDMWKLISWYNYGVREYLCK